MARKKKKSLNNCIAQIIQTSRKNLSQRGLADYSGLSRQTVRRAEETGDIRMSSFVEICKAIGKRPSDILRRAEKLMESGQ